jgi:hypothetical protein
MTQFFYNYLYKSRANKGKEISAETMKFCIFLAGFLAMAMALSQRNDEAEDIFQTATPALREDTVCPGTDDPLTLSLNSQGLIGPRIFKIHMLKKVNGLSYTSSASLIAISN